MSLDIYLRSPAPTTTTCHCCGSEIEETETYFNANYTNNVGNMADKAGLYGVVWRPEENGITAANELIGPLEKGLALMDESPDAFRKMKPPNGWGDFDSFRRWLREYLSACKEHPDALVSASR